MKDFKTIVHEMFTLNRTQDKITPQQANLISMIKGFQGPMSVDNDFEYTELIFERAKQLGLTEEEILWCIIHVFITSVISR